MEVRKKLILHLNIKIKVVEANEEEKLSVKQIVAKFNVCKAQVYEILKKKFELKEQWLNGNGATKWHKIVWEKYTLIV